MPWSEWFDFNLLSVENNAPDNPGIYRLRLKQTGKSSEDVLFVLKNGKWSLLKKKNIILLLFLSKQPFQQKTDICYIGKTERSIKERLKEHLNGSNPCIKTLLDLGIPLEFSYLSRQNPSQSEQNAYNRFIEKFEACPPCDCGSKECPSEYRKTTYVNGKEIC